MIRLLGTTALCGAVACSASAAAQDIAAPSAQPQDAEYTRLIRELPLSLVQIAGV